jgi:MFS family permease
MVASSNRKWLALALLSVVQFMLVLDIAIVNVALPSIQVDLGFSQENLQWVISAYALVFGGFLLLGGRAADLVSLSPPLLVYFSSGFSSVTAGIAAPPPPPAAIEIASVSFCSGAYFSSLNLASD